MALQNINNRDFQPYIATGNFNIPQILRIIVENGGSGGAGLLYLARDDRLIGHTAAADGGARSTRWDPALVDTTSSGVGHFLSPLSDQSNAPFFAGDFDPNAGTQRLYQCLSLDEFWELDINDPTVDLSQDAFTEITRAGPNNLISSQDGWWQPLQTQGQFLFFQGTNQAIVVTTRVRVSGSNFNSIIGLIDLSNGFCTPLGVPGRYASGENQFNRGPIFGESEVLFTNVQFLADDLSTHAQPRGELLFWSEGTDHGGGQARVYVKFVDYNPFAISGNPNRIHLRETLFSRLIYTLNSVPTGTPLSPLDGFPILNVAGFSMPNLFFTDRGSKRFHCYGADNTTVGNTFLPQHNRAAVAAFVSPPSPKGQVETNRQISYQVEVTGDLGEPIATQEVTFAIARLSTVSEDLNATGTPDETLTVDNVPIDRVTEFDAGFAVFEDSGGGPVELTETTHYTVDEALGEITFITPHTNGGSTYTIRYAHAAVPDTPAHGSVIDGSVFTTIAGVATTRVLYADTPALEGHIDQLSATTATP